MGKQGPGIHREDRDNKVPTPYFTNPDEPKESRDAKKAPAAREIDIHVRAVTNRLREHPATHVAIQHSSKKGKIEIEYYGDDDLQRLIELPGFPRGLSVIWGCPPPTNCWSLDQSLKSDLSDADAAQAKAALLKLGESK